MEPDARDVHAPHAPGAPGWTRGCPLDLIRSTPRAARAIRNASGRGVETFLAAIREAIDSERKAHFEAANPTSLLPERDWHHGC